jgi:hypothetical protein
MRWIYIVVLPSVDVVCYQFHIYQCMIACCLLNYLSASVLVLPSSETSSGAPYSMPTRNTTSKSMNVSSERPSHWASFLYRLRAPRAVLMLFSLAAHMWHAYE